MELQNFISDALEQIMLGVSQSQSTAKGLGGEVSPAWEGMTIPTPDTIEFDVAVTVADGSLAKGGIAIAAGFFGAGGGKQSESRTESISRIKFSIPVRYPGQYSRKRKSE